MGTLDLTQVLATIAMHGMRWDSYNPKSDRVNNASFTPEARGWQRMIVCNMQPNMQPIKHHTTFSMNMALLIDTLITGGRINLTRIIRDFMYHAAMGASNQRLPFPFLITRLAAACEVVPSSEDKYLTIPGEDRDCPFGDRRGEKKKGHKGDIAQPPPPIPPPIHEPQAPPLTATAASSSTAPAPDPFQKTMKMLRLQENADQHPVYDLYSPSEHGISRPFAYIFLRIRAWY
ncbi:hypothetical protein PIB30_070692 [Stylosanthes scabra]|uniref:Putative plant transposon protein domain-containing protein n=1 Tax=Stylosanthes scabra TaxID=79078 RepID=A0ABU6UP67_9FABA|nr:hypothetical protein [Stylosanthes scabra]